MCVLRRDRAICGSACIHARSWPCGAMRRLRARAASPGKCSAPRVVGHAGHDVLQIPRTRGCRVRPIKAGPASGRKCLAPSINMPKQGNMLTQSKPGFWLGVLSGLFLTVPLVAIFYLGYRLAALPFPPFNLFDWQTRILPGSVLAKSIDTMVRIIGWFHETNTSGVAKLG